MAIEKYAFDSGLAGRHLLVFGAIHGDEVCGPAAIRNVIADIESGALTIITGRVTFVPVANKKAFENRTRLIEADLNRVFQKTAAPDSHEAALANELCALADTADFLLDLHSSTAPGPINAFIDYPTKENTAFVQALGAEYEIFDWPAAYEAKGAELLSHTTERYMHEIGKSGTTFECGQHADPAAVPVGERTIRRALAHLGIVEPIDELLPQATRVIMQEVVLCENNDDVLLAPWKHLQKIPAGTCIARRQSGEEICVTVPSIIIFPYAAAEKGDEWFYLGTEKSA